MITTKNTLIKKIKNKKSKLKKNRLRGERTSEDVAEDEVGAEDGAPEAEDAAEADTEAVTEDHETVKTKIKFTIIPTITTTKLQANKLKATELHDQKPDEVASDHEVVSAVEAEAAGVEADEAEAVEVEAEAAPTKASLVITKPGSRSKPRTKHSNFSCLCQALLPLITQTA